MTKSRKEKRKREKRLSCILDNLKDKARLSNNPGIFISTKSKLSKKDRRRSGWVTPVICGKMKYSEIIEQCLEPQKYWDDWVDYRDGWRHQSIFDNTRLVKCSYCGRYYSEEVTEKNKKIRKQIAIRKAKKRKFR